MDKCFKNIMKIKIVGIPREGSKQHEEIKKFMNGNQSHWQKTTE